MTAVHWKASHILSIAGMAALVVFFVFSAFAVESSPLLSSTTAHSFTREQTVTQATTAARAS